MSGTTTPLVDALTPMNTTMPVSLFLYDAAFTSRTGASHPLLTGGGICKPSMTGLSYFSKPIDITSPMVPSNRTVGWTPETVPALIVDDASYDDFVQDAAAMGDDVRMTLFRVLDLIFFNGKSIADLETALTGSAPFNTVYVPGTLFTTAAQKSATYYTSALNGSIQVYPYVSFSLQLPYPSAAKPTQYDFTVFADDATWIAKYTKSIIESVTPNMPYQDLLTANLTTSTVNEFTLAKSISDLTFSTLGAALNSSPTSGYVIYHSTVIDPDNATNFVTIPFGLSYRGAAPTIMEMRSAVRSAVLASGVGTPAEWQARLPDLFIQQRFFIVPMWDQTVSQSDRILYSGISKPASVTKTLGYLMADQTHAQIQDNLELFPVFYNNMVMASLPDTTAPVVGELLAQFPSYQDYATSSSTFQYMANDAKTFARSLNTLLATAAGGTSVDPTLVSSTDQGLTYFSFTLNEVEYCVVTKDCYTSILKSASGS